MIKNVSLPHKWFYFYRIHTEKTGMALQNGLSPLVGYLDEVFKNCPNEYFLSGPRSSQLRFAIELDMKHVKGHEVSTLASVGLFMKSHLKAAHSRVEVFMLENDDKTVAVEVPIWLHDHELSGYEAMFNSKEALTGHIDILRIEDENVWVWDYKPNAAKEKFAHVQLLFYAIMLSKRTGIPLERFRCGYFDDKDAFMFKPSLEALKINLSALKGGVSVE
jgi:hypothetical protein